MLRSFDYAPRAAAMTASATGDDGSEQRAFRAAEWSARNQAAFLEAYAGHELSDDDQTLLAAYVADKAVYECVYEARNRPTWVAIPLAALTQEEGSR
jgi:maltokinase